ncbi:MAG TPA: DUF3006 domain-containing protein [Gemmatimonadaceae bacterium]|nr:DUF3006 domain-containing protein [Gemmatimonadaceae bacterium]
MPSSRHRWVVDGIEEHTARVEVDGDQVVTVPRWMLPEGAKGGDVLTVEHERKRGGSRLTIVADRAGTREATRKSAEQVRRTEGKSNDPGGDITL